MNHRVGKRSLDKTTGRNTKLRLSIVNIVATAKLGRRVDIEGLVGVEGTNLDEIKEEVRRRLVEWRSTKPSS